MFRRTPSMFVVAVGLGLWGAMGCSPKPQLTEVEVPDAGVSLRYDLSAGQQYDGRVKMRTSVQTPMGEIVTNLDFGVSLVVSSEGVAGSSLVRATVRDVGLDLRVPEGIPAAATGLDPAGASSLDGMELRFNLDERGEVSEMPPPPEDLTPQLQQLIGLVTSALTSGFSTRLPEPSVKGGESWDAKSDSPNERVISSSSTGRLQSLARRDGGEQIATLVYSAQIESEQTQGDRSFTVKQDSDSEVLFSASGGYPSQVKRTLRNEIVGQMTINSEIDGEWTKGGRQAVSDPPPPPAPVEETQSIADPCDPDYVGSQDCDAGGEPPAEVEAAAATETATPTP